MTSTELLTAALERAPGIVIPLVRQADPAILKRRPPSGKWSIHEHACHLTEVHALMAGRLDLMLAQDNPVIASYDPGRDHPPDALLRIDLEDALRRFREDRRASSNGSGRSAPPIGPGRAGTTSTTPTRCSPCSGTWRCTTSFTRTGSRSCFCARTGRRPRRSRRTPDGPGAARRGIAECGMSGPGRRLTRCRRGSGNRHRAFSGSLPRQAVRASGFRRLLKKVQVQGGARRAE